MTQDVIGEIASAMVVMADSIEDAAEEFGRLAQRIAVDWDQVGELGFAVAERAARHLAAHTHVEEDDAFQDCLVWLATHPARVSEQFAYGYDLPGRLGGERGGRDKVQLDLIYEMKAQYAREAQHLRLEALVAADKKVAPKDKLRWEERPLHDEWSALPYNPRVVERTMVALYDDEPAEAMRSPFAPDKGMPVASGDPSHKNTDLAQLADVRRAFGFYREIHPDEAAALFATTVLRMDLRMAGEQLGVHDTTVMRRADRALEQICTYLNGKEVPLDGTSK